MKRRVDTMVLKMVLGVFLSQLMFPATASPALMPLPRSVTLATGELATTGRWSVSWGNCAGPAMTRAFARFEADHLRLTGVTPTQNDAVSVTVTCDRSQTTPNAMQGESYELHVAPEGIRIDAAGPTGVLRALATLRQLVSLRSGRPQIPCLSIQDAPRFAWRGVMLDVARHFLEPDTLERQIDAMERVKLNVLHLHLSDDQGFRVESKRLPKLNTVSSHGQFYTQKEVKRLVAYAADRGVLIVPEFDVPGHSRSLIDAYPAIGATAAHAQPPFPADVALNPASAETYRFLDALINEMASLFPGPYFHFGGDEVGDGVWAGNPTIDAWKQREGLDSKQDVEGYFARRVIAMVRAAGKTAIGWEEVTAGGVPRDTIVQAWQSSNATVAATTAGHRTIVSAGYYLDLLMPADFHYGIDPLAPSAAGFTPAEAERIRKLHPLLARLLTDAKVAHPLPALTPEQERLVLGAEAPLWGELVTDEMVDHRLWPRAAALAERFWSSADVRDASDMYRRLAVVHDQLTIGGLRSDANRHRMIARLAPANTTSVETLLDIVTPVRNMAHDHRILAAARGQRIEQPLHSLADAAPADSLVARSFAASAQRFVAGETALEAPLRAQLAIWRDNDARFSAAAAGNRMLEPALPTSAGIASLARAGIDAIDALGSNGTTQIDWDVIEKLLATMEQQEEASRLPLASFLGTQPPADLIIAITPGIRTLVAAARARSAAPNDAPASGMVEQPCPSLPPMPSSVQQFNEMFLTPGKPDLVRLLALSQRPEFVAYNEAKKQRDAQDWAGLCRYREDNAALIDAGTRPDVVFFGDSITENWPMADPAFFSQKRVGRGIGGQTSAQMLVRFHSDVIALRPRTVHIMAGTNDVAGNNGPTTEESFRDNIRAMVELSRAHGIRVVLASIPPTSRFRWRPQLMPAAQIRQLNEWLRDYADRERLQYVDYYSVLTTDDGGLQPALTIDGTHPNRDGYAAMRTLANSVRN